MYTSFDRTMKGYRGRTVNGFSPCENPKILIVVHLSFIFPYGAIEQLHTRIIYVMCILFIEIYLDMKNSFG